MNISHKQKSLGVYIVDSDVERKLRLKQATTPVLLFKQTILFNSLEEPLQKMELDDFCDIVFLSSRFPEIEIASFISRAKKTRHGHDSTFVMVLGAKESQVSKLPDYMLLGIDSFLFEPYSVDGLTETAHLALKIKGERREAREKLAMKIMVTDCMRQIDSLSITKKFGLGSSKIELRLRSLGASVKRLPSESLSSYYSVLIEEMENAQIPEKIAQMESYKGASSRVKKTIEKKIMDELESEAESS